MSLSSQRRNLWHNSRLDYRLRNDPGFVRTPHGLREVAELQKLGVDTSEAALAAQQGRICEPEEVARAALFLASADASFVNGTHLFVDNGFTAA